MASMLQLCLFMTFLFLMMINFVAHYYLNSIERKITKKQNIMSKFSLFFKDIEKTTNL
jgi:hypothetical protein